MPLLNIYARFDHLMPPSACDQITGAVSSEDVNDLCLETGHIGIYVSSKCQGIFALAILDTELPGPGCRYLKQELEFVAPVFTGDSITANVEVTAHDVVMDMTPVS